MLPGPAQVQYNLQQEALLHQVIQQTFGPVAKREAEWDAEKLGKKVCEYLGKAAKAVNGSNKSWQQIVDDFANKFFEAFWRALGDREWVDEIDFTFIVAHGLKSYCTIPGVVMAPAEEFTQHTSKCCENAYDSCRYYSWGWQVLKKIVNNKAQQKKVRDAIDAARDEVAKSQVHANAEAFVAAWVGKSLEELAKGDKNPRETLQPTDASALFSEMIKDGGGLPKRFGTCDAKTLHDIKEGVKKAYAPYPEIQAPQKSYGPPGMNWGKGGWGPSPADFFGKGGWGPSPADFFGAFFGKGCWGAPPCMDSGKGGWGKDGGKGGWGGPGMGKGGGKDWGGPPGMDAGKGWGGPPGMDAGKGWGGPPGMNAGNGSWGGPPAMDAGKGCWGAEAGNGCWGNAPPGMGCGGCGGPPGMGCGGCDAGKGGFGGPPGMGCGGCDAGKGGFGGPPGMGCGGCDVGKGGFGGPPDMGCGGCGGCGGCDMGFGKGCDPSMMGMKGNMDMKGKGYSPY